MFQCECVCCQCFGGAGEIYDDDINSLPLLREREGSMNGSGGQFFQCFNAETHTHTKRFLHHYFHLEVRETEAGSLLCPVSWSEEEEDEEESCESETIRKNTVSGPHSEGLTVCE